MSAPVGHAKQRSFLVEKWLSICKRRRNTNETKDSMKGLCCRIMQKSMSSRLKKLLQAKCCWFVSAKRNSPASLMNETIARDLSMHIQTLLKTNNKLSVAFG